MRHSAVVCCEPAETWAARHVIEQYGAASLLQGDKDTNLISRMSLSQFKAFCSAAHIVSPKMPHDKLEEVFTAVAGSPMALERKKDSMAASTMTFLDFLLAVIHIAHHKFASQVPHPPGLSVWCALFQSAYENIRQW